MMLASAGAGVILASAPCARLGHVIRDTKLDYAVFFPAFYIA